MLTDLPQWAGFTILGFFSGSVMYSYLIPKALKNIDVRRTASDRNPGGMNALRAAGTDVGLVCIALDVLKAFFPVFLAVDRGDVAGFALVPVVVAPVLGHAFSPLLGFRGGKGVSTVFGVLLGLWPVSKIVLLLAAVTIFFRFLAVAKPDSFCVALSICGASLAACFLEPLPFIRAASFLAQSVVIFKVLQNPNPGEPSIHFRHFLLRIENRKLKFYRL
ncbi:MAG: glycerol-3-phosphate acyltransferase [Oscillospiraceae bacterium]|jgi:glycerol-3-phosphate acyltransferase PlsY|nr:glycerol-3-phosphate acyltransferase [Oscillospiraceae bacterium]MCI1991139.1 glycerol-3-phosphate acyltransferase [Oscillospiraceae bacterium]MCI2034776.1 glycerol-3-phosphate acyltransferase [Oscillospiraceae bacterium]